MREQLGKLILRLTLAGLMLFHGIAKLIGGVDPIAGMLTNAGMPPQLAYLVLVGEILAPLLILAGVWTRMAALVIALNMAVAVLLAHRADLLKMTSHGGWALELQAFFLFTALAIALLGAGRYSMAGQSGRWN